MNLGKSLESLILEDKYIIKHNKKTYVNYIEQEVIDMNHDKEYGIDVKQILHDKFA